MGGTVVNAAITIPIGVSNPAILNFDGIIPLPPATPGQKVTGKFKHTLTSDAVFAVIPPGMSAIIMKVTAPLIIEGYFDGEVTTVDANGVVTRARGDLNNIVWPTTMNVEIMGTQHVVTGVTTPTKMASSLGGMTVAEITRPKTAGAGGAGGSSASVTAVPGGDDSVDFAMFQSKGCSGKNLFYVQLKPPKDPADALPPGSVASISITLDPAYPTSPPFVPVIYGVLASVADLEFKDTSTNTTMTYQFTLESYDSSIFVFTELGYVMSSQYVFAAGNLVGSFASDVFARSPLVGSIIDYGGDEMFQGTSGLPSNKGRVLWRLRRRLRDAAIAVCVGGDQIKQMSFAAFNKEIGTYFGSGTTCCRPICCDSVFGEYVGFVTSCIQVISRCECQDAPSVDFSACGSSLEPGSACWAINKQICKFGATGDASSGIECLFSDLGSYGAYTPLRIPVSSSSR